MKIDVLFNVMVGQFFEHKTNKKMTGRAGGRAGGRAAAGGRWRADRAGGRAGGRAAGGRAGGRRAGGRAGGGRAGGRREAAFLTGTWRPWLFQWSCASTVSGSQTQKRQQQQHCEREDRRTRCGLLMLFCCFGFSFSFNFSFNVQMPMCQEPNFVVVELILRNYIVLAVGQQAQYANIMQHFFIWISAASRCTWVAWKGHQCVVFQTTRTVFRAAKRGLRCCMAGSSNSHVVQQGVCVVTLGSRRPWRRPRRT